MAKTKTIRVSATQLRALKSVVKKASTKIRSRRKRY